MTCNIIVLSKTTQSIMLFNIKTLSIFSECHYEKCNDTECCGAKYRVYNPNLFSNNIHFFPKSLEATNLIQLE